MNIPKILRQKGIITVKNTKIFQNGINWRIRLDGCEKKGVK